MSRVWTGKGFRLNPRTMSGHRRGRSAAGVAILELALLMPLLLLILMGVIELGRVFYMAMALSHAARAGAQFGAQSNGNAVNHAGMQQVAQQAAQPDIGTITATANHYCECANGTAVNCLTGACLEGAPRLFVTVTTAKTWQPMAPYPGIPSALNLTRIADMRVQ